MKPELVVRGVVRHEGALLVNRGHNPQTHKDYYALPGGHIDPGEHCLEALRREFQEELQVEIEPGELFCVSESRYQGHHHPRHELVLFFHAALRSPLPQGPEIHSPESSKRFQWLPLRDIADAPLFPAGLKPLLLAPPAAPAYFYDDSTSG